MYGSKKNVRLTLGDEYEILEKLKSHDHQWITIPEEDIQLSDQECQTQHCPSLEVELCNSLLKENVVIMVPPDCQPEEYPDILFRHTEKIVPVIIYAVSEDALSDYVRKQSKSSTYLINLDFQNIQEIKKLKDIFKLPFLFVSASNNERNSVISTESLTESEQHHLEIGNIAFAKLQNLRDQLLRLGE